MRKWGTGRERERKQRRMRRKMIAERGIDPLAQHIWLILNLCFPETFHNDNEGEIIYKSQK